MVVKTVVGAKAASAKIANAIVANAIVANAKVVGLKAVRRVNTVLVIVEPVRQ